MQLPYSEELNIEYLGQLFRNTTECYKFFWFKAIVKKVTKGKLELTYEELVDEMIADAWYMVTEYHLNLGPKDTLESLVTLIKQKNPELKSKEEKTLIIDFLKNTEDKELISKKRALTYNVPYRLQSPFLENLKGKDWNVGETKLIEKINQENRLIYYFTALNGLATKIIIQKDWAEYIVKNQQIIWGWLEYNMILYIQKRNPNVPGIADKLYPPKERKLEKIKNYWKLILSLEPIREIYGDEILTEQNISIDHFVPWSYVAHDEMWNLNPTTKSINSSKSNNLPDWDTYFKKLAQQEYRSYQLMWKNDIVHKEFEKCAKEHINSDDIRYRVYRRGLEYPVFAEELKSIIKRIRDAYNEIINNSLFEQCDNALRQLLLQQNIPDEMEDLYKILLSAEMLAQDSSTTILETYSIYTVDDIRTRLKKLDSLLELNSDFNYTITTDENDIRQRKRVDLMGLLMIHENLNYFSRLYKN